MRGTNVDPFVTPAGVFFEGQRLHRSKQRSENTLRLPSPAPRRNYMHLIAAIVMALSLPGRASSGEERASPPQWQARLSVDTVTPVALPGLAIGGSADLSRQLFFGPLFAAVQASLTAASAANESWIIDHRQLVLAVALGARTRFGAGTVWGEAGAGALGIQEILSRHQLERIQMGNVGAGAQTSFASGPYAFAEVGVAVHIRGSVSAGVSAGPTVSRIMLSGDGHPWHFGVCTHLSVSYDF
jgi:hypothetical protein